MPFAPHIIQAVEDALSGAYSFHQNLDHFLIRSGIPAAILQQARKQAEQRRETSGRAYSRAPKRYVVQELLSLIDDGTSVYDQRISALIDTLVKGRFPDADATALEAIEALKQQIHNDKIERDKIENDRKNKIFELKNRESEKTSKIYADKMKKRDNIFSDFTKLIGEENHQKRGYDLEKFLNTFFEIEGLDPRGSFKLIGEQIDGSFNWGNTTHLVEAKWVKEPVAGAEFGAFSYKLEGKSVDTRGLFISINGYSPQAIEGLKQKGPLKFVCIDGSHISRALVPGQNLNHVLSEIWRNAHESGNPYLPVSEMR